MSDTNNILLITDYEDTAKLILEKLVLLRENDRITVCNSKDAKKMLEKSLFYVIMLHEVSENNEATLKLIKTIKETKSDAEVILLLNDLNSKFIIEAYDAGIYDYCLTDCESYEILIKTINCFKLKSFKEVEKRNEKFLYQLGVMDNKNGLYKYKYLKDIFLDLSEDLQIQNGVFVILTLDETTKTKISINRLAGAIKSCVRQEDIVAIARGGKYYLILPNITLDGTKAVIQKIQDKMGSDLKIRAGLNKIGIQSFPTLDKNTQDSLISAMQNDEMCVSLADNFENKNSWLDDNNEHENGKSFKLFQCAFTNKLNNVITPIFFRFQKECETKLTNTQVSQYANSVECVFSLKTEELHSELIIRYNGYAKFKIKIKHSGLESAENTTLELPLSKLTEKELNRLLKQLKDEYKETLHKKGN